jgi:hypothetical protein
VLVFKGRRNCKHGRHLLKCISIHISALSAQKTTTFTPTPGYSDSCPEGSYSISTDPYTCDGCSTLCLTCSVTCSGTSDSCTGCPDGQVLLSDYCITESDCEDIGFIEKVELVSVCSVCDDSCAKCDVDPSFCTECDDFVYLYPELLICSNFCSDGYYSESGMSCYPCETGCETCESSSVCVTCSKDYYLYEDYDCLYLSCPFGYFEDSEDRVSLNAQHLASPAKGLLIIAPPVSLLKFFLTISAFLPVLKAITYHTYQKAILLVPLCVQIVKTALTTAQNAVTITRT